MTVRDALTKGIIGCAIRVHQVLGPGYLESVYHRALEHELRRARLSFESEVKLEVRYDNVVVGTSRLTCWLPGACCLS
jgi:GxxExxY protein